MTRVCSWARGVYFRGCWRLKMQVAEHRTTGLKWETLRNEGNAYYGASSAEMARAKVPGGWLLRLELTDARTGSSSGCSIAFYPDPEHIWDGTSLR